MPTHNHPPAIREHGLQDGCERCAAHAVNPCASLDDDNLTALVRRTIAWTSDEEVARSDTELAAMKVVSMVLIAKERFDRLGLGLFA